MNLYIIEQKQQQQQQTANRSHVIMYFVCSRETIEERQRESERENRRDL